jgi:hypothetical protein
MRRVPPIFEPAAPSTSPVAIAPAPNSPTSAPTSTIGRTTNTISATRTCAIRPTRDGLPASASAAFATPVSGTPVLSASLTRYRLNGRVVGSSPSRRARKPRGSVLCASRSTMGAAPRAVGRIGPPPGARPLGNRRKRRLSAPLPPCSRCPGGVPDRACRKNPCSRRFGAFLAKSRRAAKGQARTSRRARTDQPLLSNTLDKPLMRCGSEPGRATCATHWPPPPGASSARRSFAVLVGRGTSRRHPRCRA